MEITGRTVLITGGGSGIGRALADRFLAAGASVAICGRRREVLDAARTEHPELLTRVCDLAEEKQRRELADWAAAELPSLDVLVNNAGIQRYPRLAEPEPWGEIAQEIEINLAAPIHLTRLLLPRLLEKQRAAVLNVTSGLAFTPLARAPIYSATKAAMHSFTLSLRQQLRGTAVEVIEFLPPAVDTDLGGPGLYTFGVPVDDFADAVMAGLAAGDREIAHGFAEQSSRASREELDAMFERMNAPRE